MALHRPDYVRAPKIQKPSVARVIVRAIRNGDPPGRFLRKDEKTQKWYDIGDKKAAEKTSQALREKANEVKDQETPTKPFASPTLVLPAATSSEKAPLVDTAGKVEEKVEVTNESGAGGIKKDGEVAASGDVGAGNGEEKKVEPSPAPEVAEV